MNQILVTERGNGGQGNKFNEPKKLVGINAIVIFFAISIIILGICMIAGSVFAKEGINETVQANMKPVVNVTKNDENNTIEINVKHIRGIKTIEYNWNEEESKTIEGNNSTEINEEIELIGGTNVLSLKITEENGESVTYKKEYTAPNLADIQLEAVANGVKVTVTSEEMIDYIKYRWNNGEEQKVEVGDTKYEGTINTPKGQNRLKIEVVDINNAKSRTEKIVVGDTEPTLKLSAKIQNGKKYFVIDAEDDEEISKIEITQNEGTKQTFDVKSKTYHQEIEMTEGLNKLLVTVYNKNGLSVQRGGQHNNE